MRERNKRRTHSKSLERQRRKEVAEEKARTTGHRKMVREVLGFDKIKLKRRFNVDTVNPCAEIPLDTSGSMINFQEMLSKYYRTGL